MKKTKNWPQFKKNFLKWKLDYLSLALLMTGHYTRLQWNDYIGDPDGFYHAKIAAWLVKGKFITSLPWMQYSTLREHFTDQHFLYHLLQAPLTLINNDPLLGVKISAVIFAVAMILVFYWLLKKLGVIWPWLFSFLFITLSSLNFRLSLIKVTALSLIMVWLIIYALYQKKYKLLAVLGFIYVWLYGGWPLAIFIFILYWLANQIYDYIHHKKIKLFHNKLIILIPPSGQIIDHRPLLGYLLAGLILGIIINPYFPHSLYFYLQLMNISVFNFGHDFPVGGEWYGTSFASIVASSPHLFALAAIILVILFFNYKKISRLSWFSFLLTFAFLILTAKSRRYVEYYSPCLLFFIATSTTDTIKIISWKKFTKFWQKLSSLLKIYLLLNLLVLGVLIMPEIYKHIFDIQIPQNPRLRFQAAANWLKTNTPEKSIVWHDDWDQWPMLFYFNDHNYYLIGLDFTLMYRYDPTLQKEYMDISANKIAGPLSPIIKKDFKADYILVERTDHMGLVGTLNQEADLPLVYSDDYFNIYRIKP